MAKLRVFSVYDSKVESYMQPWYARTIAEAQRDWVRVCNDGESMMSKHPSDYTLFQIGDYDDQTASITPLKALHPVSTALEAKRIETPLSLAN